MQKRTMIVAASAALVLAAAGGVAVATTGDEGSVTGPEADRAGRAAVNAVGGGTVEEVEHEGENGASWEVEVAKPDGSTVEVQLDESFKVVSVGGDDEPGDDDGGGDDSGQDDD